MFKDLLAKAFTKLQEMFPVREQELVSPLPEDYQFPQARAAQMPAASPSPTPTPQIQPRNPNWEVWQRQNPKGFEELLAGARQASERHGVPADMLMDMSGLETSGGLQMNPPAGHTARGYFMFNEPTLSDPYLPVDVPEDFDPMSATDSADLAAQLMKKKQMGRWAVANGKGAGGNSMRDFYSPEELSPYLR